MAYLAYCSIRSKQSYIFRTNFLLEITGASRLISGAWDTLIDAAKVDVGLRYFHQEKGEAFNLEKIRTAFDSGIAQFVEVYRGGGNETLLFDSKESFSLANAAFTNRLIRKAPGMVPICVGVEVDIRDKGHYKEDWDRLMKAVSAEKAKMLPMDTQNLLPFSLQDRNTLQPVITRIRDRDCSAEAAAKYAEGRDSAGELDRMVTEKGSESLLAIVHADGNRMGEKISELLKGVDGYDECITKLRQFSVQTDEVFARKSCEKVNQIARKLVQEKSEKVSEQDAMDKTEPRWLIQDGDDVTFLCNARLALLYTQAYLTAVEEEEGDYSSCAGICIFHSHYPCYMAYQIAEDACESAKAALRETNCSRGSLIDFHYIHSGLGSDLSEIRDRQGVASLVARPFRLHENTPGKRFSLSDIKLLDEAVKEYGVSRSNIKTIGTTLESSRAQAEMELSRVYSRAPGLKKKLGTITNDDKLLESLIYDYSEMYDLWFRSHMEV